MATSTSLNNKQKWPFLGLSTVDPLTVSAEGQEFNSCFTGSFLLSPSSCYNYLLIYIYVFPFAILGINQGHNLKFEALIEVRPLTTLEGGQVATGGVNGESFGDDLLKKIFMCLILAVLGLCWCVGFLYFQRAGATP